MLRHICLMNKNSKKKYYYVIPFFSHKLRTLYFILADLLIYFYFVQVSFYLTLLICRIQVYYMLNGCDSALLECAITFFFTFEYSYFLLRTYG
jgi:hypothetical protein